MQQCILIVCSINSSLDINPTLFIKQEWFSHKNFFCDFKACDILLSHESSPFEISNVWSTDPCLFWLADLSTFCSWLAPVSYIWPFCESPHYKVVGRAVALLQSYKSCCYHHLYGLLPWLDNYSIEQICKMLGFFCIWNKSTCMQVLWGFSIGALHSGKARLLL